MFLPLLVDGVLFQQSVLHKETVLARLACPQGKLPLLQLHPPAGLRQPGNDGGIDVDVGCQEGIEGL